jgi:hypothetical protein
LRRAKAGAALNAAMNRVCRESRLLIHWRETRVFRVSAVKGLHIRRIGCFSPPQALK